MGISMPSARQPKLSTRVYAVFVYPHTHPERSSRRPILGIWAPLFFGLGAICFGMFYVGSQVRQQGLLRACLLLPVVFATGISLCINNTKAVLEACCGHISPFIRTPKVGITNSIPQKSTGYAIPANRIINIIEYMFLFVYIACLGICIEQDRWRHVPMILLFCGAFATPLWSRAQMMRLTDQRTRTMS